MLEEKNVLLRHYTQNIDTLERVADISDKKLIEAHGSFYGNHCIKCRKAYDMAFVKGTYIHINYNFNLMFNRFKFH